MRVLCEQRSRRHDLPRRAVTALNHFEIEPGLLHLGARLGGADALDRGDGAVANRSNRKKTRAHRSAVDMHGAGATLGDATAIFSTRHPKHIAQHPQQWGFAVDIDVVYGTVDADSKSHVDPAGFIRMNIKAL